MKRRRLRVALALLLAALLLPCLSAAGEGVDTLVFADITVDERDGKADISQPIENGLMKLSGTAEPGRKLEFNICKHMENAVYKLVAMPGGATSVPVDEDGSWELIIDNYGEFDAALSGSNDRILYARYEGLGNEFTPLCDLMTRDLAAASGGGSSGGNPAEATQAPPSITSTPAPTGKLIGNNDGPTPVVEPPVLSFGPGSYVNGALGWQGELVLTGLLTQEDGKPVKGQAKLVEGGAPVNLHPDGTFAMPITNVQVADSFGSQYSISVESTADNAIVTRKITYTVPRADTLPHYTRTLYLFSGLSSVALLLIALAAALLCVLCVVLRRQPKRSLAVSGGDDAPTLRRPSHG